ESGGCVRSGLLGQGADRLVTTGVAGLTGGDGVLEEDRERGRAYRADDALDRVQRAGSPRWLGSGQGLGGGGHGGGDGGTQPQADHAEGAGQVQAGSAGADPGVGEGAGHGEDDPGRGDGAGADPVGQRPGERQREGSPDAYELAGPQVGPG